MEMTELSQFPLSVFWWLLGGRMRLDLKQLGGHGLGSTEMGLPGVNAVALVFLLFLFL